MFWLSAGPVVASGVSRLSVPWEPCDCWLLVDSVVFHADFPPDAQMGSEILVTGGGVAQNRDFQALKTPYSCGESVLCA